MFHPENRHAHVPWNMFARACKCGSANAPISNSCSNSQEDAMKKNTEIALALLLVMAMIGVAIVAYVTEGNPPPQTFDWQAVAQISGAGRQDTTEFSMNNPRRVAWSIQKQSDNFFLVAVYIKNGTGYSPIAEADETQTNTTQGFVPVSYTGSFVIRVIAMHETEWTCRFKNQSSNQPDMHVHSQL